MNNIDLNNSLSKIIQSDCIEAMRQLGDECIDLTFTSPPYYNAREYAQYDSYEAYLAFLSDVFNEVHRITKEGRFLIVNTSHVIVARKGRSENSKRYPIPFDLNSILIKNGWDFIDDIVWVKPEASVTNRVTNFNRARKPLYYKPNMVNEYIMVYRKHTDKLIEWNTRPYKDEILEKSLVKGDFERTNIWHINPERNKYHNAVFPAKLAENIIRYYSYVNDWVLDPFGGSGTLGAVAVRLQRKFILIERMSQYIEAMYQRNEFATNPNIELLR